MSASLYNFKKITVVPTAEVHIHQNHFIKLNFFNSNSEPERCGTVKNAAQNTDRCAQGLADQPHSGLLCAQSEVLAANTARQAQRHPHRVPKVCYSDNANATLISDKLMIQYMAIIRL